MATSATTWPFAFALSDTCKGIATICSRPDAGAGFLQQSLRDMCPSLQLSVTRVANVPGYHLALPSVQYIPGYYCPVSPARPLNVQEPRFARWVAYHEVSLKLGSVGILFVAAGVTAHPPASSINTVIDGMSSKGQPSHTHSNTSDTRAAARQLSVQEDGRSPASVQVAQAQLGNGWQCTLSGTANARPNTSTYSQEASVDLFNNNCSIVRR